MGMVVLEAKRESTPSIVFDSGGLPELINHRVNGFICAEKTQQALADAIRWMLEDRIRLQQLAIAARESYQRDFSPREFETRWQNLLADRKRVQEERKD